jgi:4'-phosphopantetheinyl transferase
MIVPKPDRVVSSGNPDLVQFGGVLADNEVHVWHANLEIPESAASSLFDLLDPDERERASRFRVPRPREQFVISHAFVRIALGRYLGVDPRDLRFRTTSHGKPELASSDLRFNLSHTEAAAVVAITRGRPVGVDVESIRANLDPLELAERFFSPQETQWLRAQPPSEHISSFFACWTAKEAYIKACGEGLSIPLNSFGVKPGDGLDRLVLEIYGNPERSEHWSMWRIDLGPNLRCALAVEDKNVVVRVGQWAWRQNL